MDQFTGVINGTTMQIHGGRNCFSDLLVKGQVISWFRIQEMFRLSKFSHVWCIGSAVVVGIISVLLIKEFNIKTINGDKIVFCKKQFNKGQIYGLDLWFWWALTGACRVRCSRRSARAHS
jgi:hypothetical protein